MKNEKLFNKLIPILGSLIIICFFSCILNIFDGGFYPTRILASISYVPIILYFFVLYKKPHGNDVKTMYLIYATVTAIGIDTTNNVTLGKFMLPIAIVLMAYMAGRLDRLNENKIIITIVCAILIITTTEDIIRHANFANSIDSITNSSSMMIFKVTSYIKLFGTIVQYLIISGVYILRYDEHIKAGKAIPKKSRKKMIKNNI